MDDEEMPDFDFTSKKKKKVKRNVEKEKENEELLYSYDFLIGRIYQSIGDVGISNKTKLILPVPILGKDGPKKVIWCNFSEICHKLNRDPIHIRDYVLVELGTIGNFNQDGQLVIRGRFTPKQMEPILKRYIESYVRCKNCKNNETLLSRKSKQNYLQCTTCRSEYTVENIKTGFKANIHR
jgi:translation initiation factor 2 subunit 2